MKWINFSEKEPLSCNVVIRDTITKTKYLNYSIRSGGDNHNYVDIKGLTHPTAISKYRLEWLDESEN